MDRIERVIQMGTGGKFAPPVAVTIPFEVIEAEEGCVILGMKVIPTYSNPKALYMAD